MSHASPHSTLECEQTPGSKHEELAVVVDRLCALSTTHSQVMSSKISRGVLTPLSPSQRIGPRPCIRATPYPNGSAMRDMRLAREDLRRTQIYIRVIRLRSALQLTILMIIVASLMYFFLETSAATTTQTRSHGFGGTLGGSIN